MEGQVVNHGAGTKETGFYSKYLDMKREEIPVGFGSASTGPQDVEASVRETETGHERFQSLSVHPYKHPLNFHVPEFPPPRDPSRHRVVRTCLSYRGRWSQVQTPLKSESTFGRWTKRLGSFKDMTVTVTKESRTPTSRRGRLTVSRPTTSPLALSLREGEWERHPNTNGVLS